MKKDKILFVTIKNEYIEFLSKYEYKIAQKNKRIWIGVIFQVKHYMYFAPLSSPKIKHLHMKEQVDFIKIAEGKYGVINFNNMIPINDIDNYEILDFDSQESKYRNVLYNQFSWIRKHRNKISDKAENLYTLVKKLYKKKNKSKNQNELLKRCVNFKKLEEIIENTSYDYTIKENDITN